MQQRTLPRSRTRCTLEMLEPRRLLAVISVTDFGARPDDGVDDVFNIQRAINNSRAGDTIYFPAGVYNVNMPLGFLPDRTYKAAEGAIIRGHGSGGYSVKVTGNNITITGFTFEGGGIFLERPGGSWNENIVIDYNVFRLNTQGQHKNAITFTSGLKDSRITNNLFTGYQGGFGIYGYNWDTLVIANNEFVNITAGIHIDGHRASSKDMLVEQNYFTGIKGMGVELQTHGLRTIVQDNYFEKPNLSSTFHHNDTSFAFSIILDRSFDTIVRRNVVIAPERPDGVGVRIGFELGGTNVQAYDNYVNGINHVAILNTSRDGKIFNNSFHNYLQAASAYGGRSPGAQIYNNNLDPSQLTWDINRPKPGIGGKRIDTDDSWGWMPGESYQPAAPSNLTALLYGNGRVALTWEGLAGMVGYEIERSYDGNTWSQIGRTTNVQSIDTGMAAGVAQYRVRGFNAAGFTAYSNIATVNIAPYVGGPIGSTPPPNNSNPGNPTQPGTGGGVTQPNVRPQRGVIFSSGGGVF